MVLARRPHSRCVHKYRTALSLCRQHSSIPKVSVSSRDSRTIAAKSGIPLHVGLDRNPENLSAISRIPIPKGQRGEVFVPPKLSRPLGLQYPPQPGQNCPVDLRTKEQKRADFYNKDKRSEDTRIYLRSYLRPYYQEWSRSRHARGKSFVSSNRLFKKDKALYFPNVWGSTLSLEGDGPHGGRDMTPMLKGKISIIGMQAAKWAEEQVATFIGPEANPELEHLLERYRPKFQRIDVNMQPDWFRMLLVKWARGRLRSTMPKDRWDKYFMIKLPRDIKPGLREEVRDAMGLLNAQVGYVYLVDSNAKIRWAGSGDAWEGEVAGLNAAIVRLVEEEKASSKATGVLPSPA
jgi:mitochondrial ATPase complex subunit ATP10